MKLETQNIKIVPLNLSQFSLLLQGIDKMEKALDLVFSNEILNEDTQVAMERLYKQALQVEDSNYLWYTNWQFILKSENKSVGSAFFIKKVKDNNIL